MEERSESDSGSRRSPEGRQRCDMRGVPAPTLPLRRLRAAFRSQRSGAKRRDVPFLLTFYEWNIIWRASGHLDERGCHRGQYVMARDGDKGPYVVGNVEITRVEKNCGAPHFGNHFWRLWKHDRRGSNNPNLKHGRCVRAT